MKVKLFRNAYSRNAAFNWMVVLCLLVYAAVMLYLLYFRQRYLMWGYSYNLVPFKTIQSYINSIGRMNSDIWIKNLFGNIILFIPIGVFMPLLNKKLRASILVITWCALLILIVELVQLLTKRGSFDVDDIILNTLGAWIGLMLVRPFLKKI